MCDDFSTIFITSGSIFFLMHNLVAIFTTYRHEFDSIDIARTVFRVNSQMQPAGILVLNIHGSGNDFSVMYTIFYRCKTR